MSSRGHARKVNWYTSLATFVNYQMINLNGLADYPGKCDVN